MTAQPPTIPAAHLDALGFALGDPPVQTATNLPVGVWQWRAVLTSNPKTLLALEESMPALLRALARQYGATLEPGEVPTWWRTDAGWTLARPGLWEQSFAPSADALRCERPVDGLEADMGRLEALAAVIAWLVSR